VNAHPRLPARRANDTADARVELTSEFRQYVADPTLTVDLSSV
jgi:hypothetical protein